ncbi:dihydroorotase, homodimeric type [Phytophthora cinnamomi]|uniref:dihydroorotase, homodimeric type n=1 Tax=Phytophthora cinnamomi TaxID=4785 RepID=UPI00355A68B1|nr:dihydroorotase, homodimeric type [Phytophthora cinnamomi]
MLEGNVTLVLSESHATSQFARCIVMPNLVPPVTPTERALAYHERVLVHVPEERHDPSGAKGFESLVTIYMTDGGDRYDGRYHRRQDPPRCRHDQDLYRQALPWHTIHNTHLQCVSSGKEHAQADVLTDFLMLWYCSWSDDQHVTKIDNLYLALETMSEAGMPQLVHARPPSWSSRSSRWWPSSRTSRWS